MKEKYKELQSERAEKADAAKRKATAERRRCKQMEKSERSTKKMRTS